MRFGRLTLGFGVLGMLAIELYGVVWLATHSDEGGFELVSPGEQLFIAGFVGFLAGAVVGSLIWTSWVAWSWLTCRLEE